MKLGDDMKFPIDKSLLEVDYLKAIVRQRCHELLPNPSFVHISTTVDLYYAVKIKLRNFTELNKE